MKRTSSWIWALAMPVGLMASGAAQAQSDQSQLARPLGAADLNGHLARLASNPRDVTALIGAGEAALALDDPRAAAGFFARADAIASGNGRIKAGLARVMLKLQNPAEALRLFDQAARLGYPDATILSDRGLARDMTGDQAGAQRDYQAALVATPQDEELIRRYAASLGIAGQIEAAEKILEPLFYKSDRAAWRYRAFIYAMNNRQAEARKIALQTMPEQLATAIAPYMQKMPYLTPAQKAAAVHFGHFPQQIGTTIAAITPTPPAPGILIASRAPATVAAAPTQTKPLSRAEKRRQRREATRLAQAQGLADSRAFAARQAAPAVRPAPTPTPTPIPASPQLAQADRVQPLPATRPASGPAAQSPVPSSPGPSSAAQVQPLPASSSPAASTTAPSASVQPLPATASAGGMPVTPSTGTVRPLPANAAPAVRQAAAPTRDVQGPPAPGFESISPSTPAAPPSASPGSQINAITLAQAATPPATAPEPAPEPAPVAAAQAVPQPPAETASAQPAPAQLTPAPPQQPDAAATRTLADIIRAIDVPETEKQASVAAVDLNEIATLQAARRAERQAAAKAAADKAKKDAAAKAKAEADAKAKAEAEEKKRLAANPSRNWLQVGVGQSKSALGFTMKGLRKKYSSLAAQEAWSASWSRTNRLLVGPFASFARAKEVEDKLKAAGADAFAWRSDAGEVVEKLAGD